MADRRTRRFRAWVQTHAQLRRASRSSTSDQVWTALFFGSPETRTFTASAVIRSAQATSTSANAVIAARAFTAGAVIAALPASPRPSASPITAGIVRVDQLIGEDQWPTGSTWRSDYFWNSRIVREQSVTGYSFSAGAWFVSQGEQSGSFTASSWKIRTPTASLTANAAKRDALAGSTTANAALRKAAAGTFTADSVAMRVTSSGFTADALRHVLAGDFAANAAILATPAASFTADADIERTFSVNAVIRPYPTFTASAIIEAVVFSDDFNRVGTGLGSNYTYSYGLTPTTDGSTLVVANSGTHYAGQNIVNTTLRQRIGISDPVTFQIDLWVPSSASMGGGFRSYYYFEQAGFWAEISVSDPGSGVIDFIVSLDGPTTDYSAHVFADESSWYVFKVRRGGGEEKAKFWKRGDPEPDWQVTGAPATNPGTGPFLEVDSTNETGKADNLVVWSSVMVPKTFTASAFLQATRTSSFTANANIAAPGKFALRSVLRKAAAGSFTADVIRRETKVFSEGGQFDIPDANSGANTFGALSSTITLNRPGIVDGAALVAFISYGPGGSSTRKFSALPGWVEIARSYDSGYTHSLQAFVRFVGRAADEPSSYTFSTNDATSVRRVGQLTGVTSTAATTPLLGDMVVNALVGTTGSGTSHTIDSLIDWSVAGTLIVASAGSDGSGSWTQPSLYVELADINSTSAALEVAVRTRFTPSITSTLVTSTSSVTQPDIMVSVAFKRRQTGIRADAFLQRVTFTADAVIVPLSFTANAVKYATRERSFTADAYVIATTTTASFTASAVKRVTVSSPAAATWTAPYTASNTASGASSVSLNWGAVSNASWIRLALVIHRRTSGAASSVIPSTPADASVIGTYYDTASRTRFDLVRIWTLASVQSFYDPNFATSSWIVVAVAFAPSVTTTGSAIRALARSAVQSTESPLGDVTTPAASGGMVAILDSILTSSAGTWTPPPGANFDVVQSVAAWSAAAFSFRPVVDAQIGPHTASYSTPTASPSTRVGWSVGINLPGGFTVDAGDFIAGFRVAGSFTAGAYLASPFASTQRHARGDDMHAGYTPSDEVITTVAVGPFPAGSTLHPILEWMWAQYSLRASINQTWGAFTSSAALLKARAASMTANARILSASEHPVPINAVLRKGATGTFTANAERFDPGVTTVEDVAFLDAVIASVTREDSLTADAELV